MIDSKLPRIFFRFMTFVGPSLLQPIPVLVFFRGKLTSLSLGN